MVLSGTWAAAMLSRIKHRVLLVTLRHLLLYLVRKEALVFVLNRAPFCKNVLQGLETKPAQDRNAVASKPWRQHMEWNMVVLQYFMAGGRVGGIVVQSVG